MGRKAVNETGNRYGRLVVKERIFIRNQNKAYWLCDCDCGEKDVIVQGLNLRKGYTRSCGCLREELSSKRMKENNKKRASKKEANKMLKNKPNLII